MMTRSVRIGGLSDQDGFRRADVLAMSPNERLMCLIRLRDRQFAGVARPIRGSGVVSLRSLATAGPKDRRAR